MCSAGYSCWPILLLLVICGNLVVDCVPISTGDDPCSSRRWWGCKLKQTNNGQVDKQKQKEQLNNLFRGVLGELVSGMKNGRKRGYDDQDLTKLFENFENKLKFERAEREKQRNEVEKTHRLHEYLKILYGLVDREIKELDHHQAIEENQQTNTT